MNVTRITGMASGMDTESTIKKLMAAHRVPQDKLKQKKQVLEWQRTDYRAINTSLSTLRDKLLPMKLQSSFLARKVDSTDANVVTGTATTDAVLNSTMTISNITLATSARLESAAPVSGVGTPIDKSAALTAQTFGAGSPAGVIGFTITNAQADGTAPKSKTFSYDLGGAASGKTLQDIMNDVNSSGIGVTMLYDSNLDKVVLQSKNTGDLEAGDDLTITGDNFLGAYLNLGAAANGTDASFKLNNVVTNSKTNDPTFYGVKLSLKKTENSGTEYTLGVKSDSEKVLTTIKDFITQYNNTLSTLNAKVSETRYRDYAPLTDEQRQDLSDTDIKNWEDKAKSGLLRNDSTIIAAINNLRKDAYSSVSGTSSTTLNQLSAIGISSYSYSDNGKLIIDEIKLKAKIEEDPDAIMQMFTNTSTTDPTKKGIAIRMYDNINTAINNIYVKAGNAFTTSAKDSSTIGKSLRDVDTQILDWTIRLADIENSYYKKFTAMESAINKMNAQSASLTSLGK